MMARVVHNAASEAVSTFPLCLVLPVGEALSHPQVGQGGEEGAGGLALGRDGLGGVWGAAHHGPAHTGASQRGRR